MVVFRTFQDEFKQAVEENTFKFYRFYLKEFGHDDHGITLGEMVENVIWADKSRECFKFLLKE